MTRNQLKFREKACVAQYKHHDKEEALKAIMELYDRMPYYIGNVRALFRYRPLKDYEVEALQDQTIYMTWPSTYSDENDCAPVIDYKGIYDDIKGGNNSADRDRFLKRIDSDDRTKPIIDGMRDKWMIACFTERFDNDKMWKEYAGSYTGICLAYDFMDVLNEIARAKMMQLMPVRYVENRGKCRDIFWEREDLINPNDKTDDKFKLACVTKEKIKFSFEEEWRLIYPRVRATQDKLNGECISFVNPRYIICGEYIDKSSANYQKLSEIAEEKGIEIMQS